MKVRRVFLEIDGELQCIGLIHGDRAENACFSYSPEYLAGKESRPVSISLPLREEPFSPRQTRSFFDGLLPEGFLRRSLASAIRADESDYLAILDELGGECLGAVQIGEEPGGVNETAGYEKLSDEDVRRLAAEGISESVQMIVRSRLSLTGASGKTGLYYDEANGNWYLPLGSAPSTHIIKQSHVRLDGMVTNEQLCLTAASLLGIDVPESFIINLADGDEKDILFAVKRFDRYLRTETIPKDRSSFPLRLHQEDLAQALGIPAEEKYEPDGGSYLAEAADLLRQYSAEPITDQKALWDRVIFDYLIGNTDHHLKNTSLLYNRSLTAMRLAPAYDLVSTVIYRESTRNMAFHIGGDYHIDRISRESFIRASRDIGIGKGIAMDRFDELRERFPEALKEAEEVLAGQGFDKAPDIALRIRENRKI